MPLKFSFIQTSDLHLGADLSNFGKFASSVEKATIETFERIASLAKKSEVHALLIPGNLFDSPTPTPRLIKIVKKAFESIRPIKVFITPGSSDPCIEGSPYLKDDWPDNVHIFTQPGFTQHLIPDQQVVIYAFTHTKANISSNPLKNFHPQNDEDYTRILLLNGSIIDVGYIEPKPSAPFRFQDLMEAQCHYAALGRFRRIQSLKLKGERSIRGCYAGVPQGVNFNDEGPKGVLKVSIEGDKKSINFIPTALIKFQSLTLNCQGMKDEDEIITRLSTIIGERNLQEIPTRIILTGSLDMERVLDLSKIESTIESKCFFVKIENRTVVGYDVKGISMEESARGFFAHTILDKINSLNMALETSDKSEIPLIAEEKEVYELALKYGLDAFTREEVKKRWL